SFLCLSLSTRAPHSAISPLSLHDALPISHRLVFDQFGDGEAVMALGEGEIPDAQASLAQRIGPGLGRPLEGDDVALGHGQEILQDRKSTRLNSSHVKTSYAVFCLKKKKKK